MIALSTAWGMKLGAKTAHELVGPLLRMGFEGMELDFRVTPQLLQELLPALKGGGVKVVSLHNFCPVPDPLPHHKASGDAFNMASLDPEERREAIRWTCRTLEVAHELEAKAVVLHLGYMDLEGKRPHELYRQGQWDDGKLKDYLHLRASKAPPHLDAVLICLDRILRRAEELGVVVGIENRYYLHEFPFGEEIGRILQEFRGAPIGYWHDTGHAHVLEVLGALKGRELLERYASQLAGVHLHDANDLKDHLPPGRGTLDFGEILRLLPEGTVTVMEIHPPATEEEIAEGLKMLKKKGV